MVVQVTRKNEEGPIKNIGTNVSGGIRLKFKIIVILLTCKNEEDRIKNEGTRVLTRLYVDFSDTQGQLTPESVVESG